MEKLLIFLSVIALWGSIMCLISVISNNISDKVKEFILRLFD